MDEMANGLVSMGGFPEPMRIWVNDLLVWVGFGTIVGMLAKLIMPDTEPVPAGGHEKLVMERSHHKNVILAAASGTTDGLRLAANIGAMLVAFVALIALFNGLVGWAFSIVGIDGITLQLILGKIFQPLMYLLSVPWEEAEAVGALFGEKLILNEFVAFSHLNEYLAGMSPRAIAIATFSLCGFANLSSIAILLGGLAWATGRVDAEIFSPGVQSAETSSASGKRRAPTTEPRSPGSGGPPRSSSCLV